MFELTEQTFTLYAIKHYDNPACKGMAEFHDDLKKFRYLKDSLGNTLQVVTLRRD